MIGGFAAESAGIAGIAAAAVPGFVDAAVVVGVAVDGAAVVALDDVLVDGAMPGMAAIAPAGRGYASVTSVVARVLWPGRSTAWAGNDPETISRRAEIGKA